MDFSIEQKLGSLVEGFKRSLVDISNNERARTEELEKSIVSYQESEKELKAQEENVRKQAAEQREFLDKEKEKVILLQKELQDEISKYQDMEKTLSKTKESIQTERDDAVTERKMASEILSRAVLKEKDYQQKLKALEDDRIQSDSNKNANIEKSHFLLTREKLLLKKEEELSQKELDYQDRVNDLAKKEKSFNLKERNAKTAKE